MSAFLLGAWLPKSCLVIAAGANHWFERELDDEAVARAGSVDATTNATQTAARVLIGRHNIVGLHLCG